MVPKLTKKTLGVLTNKVSPRTPEKFFLDSPSKNSDQPKTNQPLALTANNEEKPSKKEAILLTKIKQLEEQLKQTQQLVHQEKQRANQAEQQLKVIIKSLYQWQKINYYQQLEQKKHQVQRAQIIQPPPWKG